MGSNQKITSELLQSLGPILEDPRLMDEPIDRLEKPYPEIRARRRELILPWFFVLAESKSGQEFLKERPQWVARAAEELTKLPWHSFVEGWEISPIFRPHLRQLLPTSADLHKVGELPLWVFFLIIDDVETLDYALTQLDRSHSDQLSRMLRAALVLFSERHPNYVQRILSTVKDPGLQRNMRNTTGYYRP